MDTTGNIFIENMVIVRKPDGLIIIGCKLCDFDVKNNVELLARHSFIRHFLAKHRDVIDDRLKHFNDTLNNQ